MQDCFSVQSQYNAQLIAAAPALLALLGLVLRLTNPEGMSSAYLATEAGEDMTELHLMVSGVLDDLKVLN